MCKRSKPAKNFHIDTSRTSGLSSRCKVCARTYMADKKHVAKTGNRRINKGVVASIRYLWFDKPLRETAKTFKLSPTSISNILNNRTWFDPDYTPKVKVISYT